MNRRTFLRGLGVGMAACVTGTGPTVPARAISQDGRRKRPNILYIMADDHTSQAIGCYGGRLKDIVRTGNIDRIAAEGMRLTNCFCTNSICVPSRATILTGQYSHANGVYTLNDQLEPGRDNVAKRMRTAGYATAIIGKWHLKTSPEGFDYWNILPGQGRYNNPVMKQMDGSQKVYEGYSTDVITDLALEWLERRDKDKPFFLMTHFKNSHAPWQWPKRNEKMYDGVEIPEPESLFEDLSHRSDGSREYGFTVSGVQRKRMQAKAYPTGQLDTSGMSEREAVRAVYRKYLEDYLRCVAAIDENVGRLLDYLKKQNLEQDTLVIYTSDQGLFLGEHNYIDKRWMYEESLRMPFLARYPSEITAGSVSDAIVINADFAPTFLDFAGAGTPKQMQGRSMRGVLSGHPPADWRESMYYRYWMHGERPAHYGIRTKDYKLIYFYGQGLGMKGAAATPTKTGWELYDLRKDPHELRNQYNNPEHGAIVETLKAELARLRRELGDNER